MNWTAMGSTGIPFARLAVGGAFLLASAGALIAMRPQAPVAIASTSGYQLVLNADREPYELEYFGSQWSNGPVLLDHDASDGRRVQYVHRFPFVDGCWWESTETLVPMSKTQYRYTYSDRIVSCSEDANEGIPSTRTGIVNVLALK
jgi:hypothetical protein